MQFWFRALDAQGVQQTGQLQADDARAAVQALVQRNLTPLEVTDRSATAPARARPGRSGPVSKAEQAGLLGEFATLLGAGISLAEALPSLATAYAATPLGPGLASMEREVRTGSTFSAALERSGMQWPEFVLALAQAGEASGDLAGTLRDAAAQLEHERKVAQDLRSALIYPAVLVVCGVLAVLVIFIGVVPRFAGLLKGSRADVPALSRWVIESGVFLKEHMLGFSLAAAGCIALVVVCLANPGLRARALELASRLPAIGPWLVRVDLARWATVLGALLANRVPILQAMDLSGGALRIGRFRRDLQAVALELQRGRAMADALADMAWFPPARLNLIRVGERSGELPRMLSTLGRMETDAARTLQARVVSLVEPAAILVMGGVIGVIMVAVMMAITGLNTAVA